MPEKELATSAWNVGPWLIGLVTAILSAFGIAVRNEYTTKKINSTLYDKNNDLRMVKKDDFKECQKTCRQSLKDGIATEAKSRREDRDEMRDDLKLIHQKIDDLPEKMIRILKASK
jgi:hypothetical protein